MLAAEGVDEAYNWSRPPSYPIIIDPAPVLRGVVSDLRRGVDRAVISAKFHNTIADIIVGVSQAARERTGINRVALSGGVFQNIYLLGRTLDELESQGFDVLIHHRVPTNDGGIALGQAVIANARLSRGKEH
jgi:hydrogenase maturation protein HypF